MTVRTGGEGSVAVGATETQVDCVMHGEEETVDVGHVQCGYSLVPSPLPVAICNGLGGGLRTMCIFLAAVQRSTNTNQIAKRTIIMRYSRLKNSMSQYRTCGVLSHFAAVACVECTMVLSLLHFQGHCRSSILLTVSTRHAFNKMHFTCNRHV